MKCLRPLIYFAIEVIFFHLNLHFSYRVVTGDIVPDRREEFAVQVLNFTNFILKVNEPKNYTILLQRK